MINKKIILVVLVLIAFCFSLPAYAELKRSGNHYVSPSGFDENNPKFAFPDKIYIPYDLQAGGAIHSNYKRNKDACASCHSTHTAVGVSLLQWAGVSETCLACHDGTVSITYDVKTGRFYDKTEKEYFPANGGLFDTTTSDSSISMHNVWGKVFNAAAPGGSTRGEDALGRKDGETDYGKNAAIVSWDLEFTCASCHNPHGAGGNARLLNQNPNGIAERNRIKKADGVEVYVINDNNTLEWAVFPNVFGDNSRERDFDDQKFRALTFITLYPYDKEIRLFRRANDGSSFDVSKLAEISRNDYKIDSSQGYTKFKFTTDPAPDANNDGKKDYILYVEGVPGLSIGMRIKNYLKVGEEIEYKYGINEFCAACHSDYNTANKNFFINDDTRYFMQFSAQSGYYSGSGGKADKESGTYSQAFRHQVGMAWEMRDDSDDTIKALRFERDPWNTDSILDPGYSGKYITNCLTCHVAHGVSKDYWIKTAGSEGLGVIEDVYMKETNNNSALKRLPDMAVCEACHQKWKDNEGYMQNVERE